MNKKNEKKLCWNCDGSIALQQDQCPYCGVDLTTPTSVLDPFTFQKNNISIPSGESASYLGHPFQKAYQDEAIPKAPYGSFQNLAVSDEEWNQALDGEENPVEEETEQETPTSSHKSEMIALMLLLPGVVFFLFGLMLLLFSHDGSLTLEWNQTFAYFYFLGAIPLLILGWKTLR